MKKPYPGEKSTKKGPAKGADKDAAKGKKGGKMPFFAKGGMAKGKRGC